MPNNYISLIIKTFTAINLMHIAYQDIMSYKVYLYNIIFLVLNTVIIHLWFNISSDSYLSAMCLILPCLSVINKIHFADFLICVCYFFLVDFDRLNIALIALFTCGLISVFLFRNRKVPFCAVIAFNYIILSAQF